VAPSPPEALLGRPVGRSALSHNVARWLRVLALPEAFATCRGKRLRTSFLNVAAKVLRRGRRLFLRLPAAYRHAEAFVAALERLGKLPRYAWTVSTTATPAS
jgi:hypothetical protein